MSALFRAIKRDKEALGRLVLAFQAPFDVHYRLDAGYYDSDDGKADSYRIMVDSAEKGDWLLFDVETCSTLPSRSDDFFRHNYEPVNDLAFSLLLGHQKANLREVEDSNIFWSESLGRFVDREQDQGAQVQ